MLRRRIGIELQLENCSYVCCIQSQESHMFSNRIIDIQTHTMPNIPMCMCVNVSNSNYSYYCQSMAVRYVHTHSVTDRILLVYVVKCQIEHMVKPFRQTHARAVASTQHSTKGTEIGKTKSFTITHQICMCFSLLANCLMVSASGRLQHNDDR